MAASLKSAQSDPFAPTAESTLAAWRASAPEIQQNIRITTHHIPDSGICFSRYTPIGADRSLSPPLVLVHGASHARIIYHQWSLYFAKRGIPVVTIDLRGHGDSLMPAGRTVASARFEEYVQDIHTVVEHEPDLQSGKFVLLGHSMGGAVVQLYARQYFVSGLIILSSVSMHRFLRVTSAMMLHYPVRYLRAMFGGTRSLFGTEQGVRTFLLEPDASPSAVAEVLAQIGDESTGFVSECLRLTRFGFHPLQAERILFIGAANDRCFGARWVKQSARDYRTEAVIIAQAPHNLMCAAEPACSEAADYVASFVYAGISI